MGDFTTTAFNHLYNDDYPGDDDKKHELTTEDIREFLQKNDSKYFRQISDLLKDTMIQAGIPKNPDLILRVSTLSELHNIIHNKKFCDFCKNDPPEDFAYALYILLSAQEKELNQLQLEYNASFHLEEELETIINQKDSCKARISQTEKLISNYESDNEIFDKLRRYKSTLETISMQEDKLNQLQVEYNDGFNLEEELKTLINQKDSCKAKIKQTEKLLSNYKLNNDILDKLMSYKSTLEIISKQEKGFRSFVDKSTNEPHDQEKIMGAISRIDKINKLSTLLNDNTYKNLIKSYQDVLKWEETLLQRLKQKESVLKVHVRSSHWNISTINRWFTDNNEANDADTSDNSESIRNRDNVIAICFALGLSLNDSNEFLDRCNHIRFNVRCPEDYIYTYCIKNNRPFAVAKKLIHDYYIHLSNTELHLSEDNHIPSDMTYTLFNEASQKEWESDEDFFKNGLLKELDNFTSFSNTAVKEYLNQKVPVYLSVLTKRIQDTLGVFKEYKIQKYIHDSDRKNQHEITADTKETRFITRFISCLNHYSTKSALLKEANCKLTKIKIYRKRKTSQGYDPDLFGVNENIEEVLKYISDNIMDVYSNYHELRIFSDFLSDTVPASEMFDNYLPVLSSDDRPDEILQEITNKDGEKAYEINKNDYRTRKYSDSSFKDTVFKSLPHRQFFTKYEKNPEELVHDLTIRKALILLFYMNYTQKLIQEYDSGEYGLEDFKEKLDDVLEKCQLGKIRAGNHFDWLILMCIKKLEDQLFTDPESYDNDVEIPTALLNEILESSFPEV